MLDVKAMGIDGVTTNSPGPTKVMGYLAYRYLVKSFERSITLPGLYKPELPAECSDMVAQSLTRTDGQIVISAYTHSGQYNSILYITNLGGMLIIGQKRSIWSATEGSLANLAGLLWCLSGF